MLTFKYRTEEVSLTAISDSLESGVSPKMFTYNELLRATSNFSNESKLGQRGFGKFYKGYLPEVGQIAVKRASSDLKRGKKEYLRILNIISKLRHENLVQLIGWCHNRGDFLLVYEFMSNGSLDAYLFDEKNSLSWAVRYKIAKGLASAYFIFMKNGGDT